MADEVKQAWLIKKTAVKDTINSCGLSLSSDAFYRLDQTVNAEIKKAINRCQANGRKTVKARDF